MKNTVYLVFISFLFLILSGCELVYGNTKIEDPSRYGEQSLIGFAEFLPESIEEYEVNKYYYNSYAYFDYCQEIFLDITVTEIQFEQIIEEARRKSDFKLERDAYYADGYVEIIYDDYYHINSNNKTNNVSWADIDKIIYNEKTLNIIYVCFHANDSYVYPLNEFEYFNRFSINEYEYVENIVKFE